MKRSIMGLLGAALFCFMMVSPAGAADDDTFTRQQLAWRELPRWMGGGHGTIKTGNLVWLMDGMCLFRSTWNDMQSIIKALGDGKCGLTDKSKPGEWRMPTEEEVRQYSGALRLYLQNPRQYYWTATAPWGDSSKAYIVELRSGLWHAAAKDRAWSGGLAVRKAVYPPRASINPDSTASRIIAGCEFTEAMREAR